MPRDGREKWLCWGSICVYWEARTPPPVAHTWTLRSSEEWGCQSCQSRRGCGQASGCSCVFIKQDCGGIPKRLKISPRLAAGMKRAVKVACGLSVCTVPSITERNHLGLRDIFWETTGDVLSRFSSRGGYMEKCHSLCRELRDMFRGSNPWVKLRN